MKSVITIEKSSGRIRSTGHGQLQNLASPIAPHDTVHTHLTRTNIRTAGTSQLPSTPHPVSELMRSWPGV